MAIELANAYVTLAVETSKVSKQVGRMFSGVERDAKRTGRSVGKSISDGFAQNRPNVQKLSADVRQAEEQITRHREAGAFKVEQAQRRVEIAQARVNEATKKYGADSSQALRAQDQLATAQHRLQGETLKYNSELDQLNDKLARAQAEFEKASSGAQRSSTVWERVAGKLKNISSTFQDAGSRIQNVGSHVKEFGGKITEAGKSFTKLTAPVTGAVTAIAGLTTAMGFKRLVGIDTARAQITGLGFDAEKVMQDVDKGITDTSLSMAEGAAIARSALATNNIKTGEELEKQIRRVANVSAAYGLEGSHAGYLLNNILTKNKVTYGDLAQMQQNQIPIMSQLADHYGVTGDEIEKMAQNGRISIEDLNTVLDKNAGKAAESYAGSWQGIWANIKANVGKIGAAGLGKLFETIKVEAAGFLDVLRSDGFKKAAEDIGEKLAKACIRLVGVVKTVVKWFSTLSPFWKKLAVGAGALFVALGPILVVAGKIVTVVGSLVTGFGALVTAFGLVFSPVGLIVAGLALLVAGFVLLWKKSEGFRNFFIGMWEGIKSAFTSIWEGALKPAFSDVGESLARIWEKAQPSLNNFQQVLQGAWENVISPVFSAIGKVVGWLYQNIFIPYFKGMLTVFMGLVKGILWGWENIWLPVWNLVSQAILWLWTNFVQPYFTLMLEKWTSVARRIKWAWENIIQPVWEVLKAVLQALYQNVISPIFQRIGDKWKSMSDRIRAVWDNYVKPVFDRLGAIISKEVAPKFKAGVDAIKTAWERLKEHVARPVRFVVDTVINKGIVGTFNKIADKLQLDVELPYVSFDGKTGHVSRGAARALPRSSGGSFDTGGYTGDGHYLDPAGVVHKGEFVLRKKATSKIANALGLGWLNRLNQTGEVPGYAKGGMVKPVKGGRLTSGFGSSRGRYPHAGIDFAVPTGTPVFAALAGQVLKAGWNAITGRTGIGAFLGHDGNRNTYYGHLSRLLVKVGDMVKAGQVIGYSGNTGRSTGPHLHYETWVGGKPVNPAPYVSGAMLPAGADNAAGLTGLPSPVQPFLDLGAKVKNWVTNKFGDSPFPQLAQGLAGKIFGHAKDFLIEKADQFTDAAFGGMSLAGGPAGALGKAGLAAKDAVKGVANGFGWGSGAQWDALNTIVQRESGWDPNAKNPSSSARGLFQKMTSIHGALESTIGGQASWGLNYIKQRYGSPLNALAFWNRNKWYDTGGLVKAHARFGTENILSGSITRDKGGVLPKGTSVVNNFTRDPEWVYTNKQQDTVKSALDVLKGGAGTSVVFNGDVYMRDEDQFAEHFEERLHRRRVLAVPVS